MATNDTKFHTRDAQFPPTSEVTLNAITMLMFAVRLRKRKKKMFEKFLNP